MIALKSIYGKVSQFLVDVTLNTIQLNGTLSLPSLLLNEVVKACLYNFCKNAAKLILLVEVVVEIDENYYMLTEIAVFINAILIKESQSTNTIDENNLSDCLSTLFVLASIKIIWKSLGFYLNFNWFKYEWQPLNKRKIIHKLALKDETN